MSSLEGYKEWLGDRPNNMETRKEYNALMNGPVVGQDGVYHAGTGERYTEAELEKLEKNNPYRPMLGKPDENGIRPGSSGRPGYGTNSAYQEAYQAQLEAERARIQAQVDQAVNRLNAQKNTVDQQFTDAARQAYIQKMNSEKNLGQQMTAAGLSGGLTESSRLALESGYGNNLNSLTQSRDNALNEIDSSINDVKATGDISIAEAENQFALAQAQEAAAALERQQEIANQKALMEYEYQLKDQYDRSSGTGGTGSSSSQKNYYNRILGTPKLKDITDRIQEQYDQYGVKYSDDALKYDLQSLYNGGFITGDELGALAYLYNIPIK